MKKILTIFIASALLFSCANKKETDDKDEKADAKKDQKAADNKPMPDSAAMMKAWMDFMTPGPMHAMMAKWNGTWESEVSQWDMMKPGAPPAKAKATAIQTAAIGGRYFNTRFSTIMMGMPFEGMGTMGYDNVKKMFINTWADNMGTGIIYMTGTYDEATKTINLKGKQTDPIMGGETDSRQELKIIDDNSYTMSIYGMSPEGKEVKVMEGTFTKKK